MTSLSKNRVKEIAQLHAGIVQSMRRSVEDAIRIGELLTEAKVEMDHGEFLPWIEKELPFKQDTARSYMLLFKYQDKTRSLRDLTEAYGKARQLESDADAKERQRKDRLIAEKARTGVNPPGWDRSAAREEKKREDDAGYRGRVEAAREEKAKSVQSDVPHGAPPSSFEQIVDAILKEEPKHRDLELDDMRANAKQGRIFTVVSEYIHAFSGVSRQLEATYNLMRYLKRIAIELQPKTQEIAEVKSREQ